MEIFRINHLGFSYPKCSSKALNNISFSVESGEFVTICGQSGCGKSTLLKHLKSAIKPLGTLIGEIYFEGKDINLLSDKNQAESIGFVQQSLDNQIVSDKVWHEMAFGLESLGYNSEVIRQRVTEMASFFGIQDWFYKNVNELSGGQKQILCLASIMTMLPKVIILDEPTSQLDPIAASEFINMLVKINREFGITIIITEHRLEEIIPVSDRVIVMDSGCIVANGMPEAVCLELKNIDSKMISSMPVPMRVWLKVAGISENVCPLTVNQGRKWLQTHIDRNGFFGISDDVEQKEGKTSVKVNNLWFKYNRNSEDILKGVSFNVHKGEIFALLGGNGTGKSTLLSVICGYRKAYRGSVNIEDTKAKVSMLPQNPLTLFVKKTLFEELRDMTHNEQKINEVLRICNLQELSERHPYDLSGGEQQRAAMAKILLQDTDILLLDEPTKGLDNEYKAKLGQVLRNLSDIGKTVIMVSHDVEFCSEYTDKCALFFDGNIVSENTPRKFFSGNSFYTTAGNRMSRNIIDNAITANDIINACRERDKKADSVIGRKKDREIDKEIDKETAESENNNNQKNTEDLLVVNNKVKNSEKKKSSRLSNIIILMLTFMIVPFTIFAGVYYFDDKKYLFIALVVLLECMTPFFVVFEKKEKKARELVMISVLCALCVAGRMAFYMLPEFKPVVAMVIITGAALGAETGFMVGAVTMLVSNIIFGQGPWTPWQMFAMGIVGFFSGIFFAGRKWKNNRIMMAVYGFTASVIIYGGIMNPAAALMAHAKLNKQTLMAYYATGLPVDITRGIATILFVLLLARPISEKVERIKEKYEL